MNRNQCPKCRQQGKINYVTKINTPQQVDYYKCTNPKCHHTWSTSNYKTNIPKMIMKHRKETSP